MKNTNITKKDSKFIKELFLEYLNDYKKWWKALWWEWNKEQQLRFKILLSCIEWNNNSILDVWCGIWDLYKYIFFYKLDREIQDETKALNHCKKFQKQIFIHIDNVAIEVKRYILCVKKIFWSNIPNRIIRISSLYDINIEQFDGIEDFIDLKLFKIW